MSKKIAMITGASKGIGKSMAMHLAKKGYLTVLLARNESQLKAVCSDISAQGGAAVYYCVDISNVDKVKSCIQDVISKYHQIDLLFNNAGIVKFGTSTLSDSEINELLKINLNGSIYVAKYVAKQMKKQRNGYIVNLSSLSGKVAFSFVGIYTASKFGLSGFSESLAQEMSLYGVKVTNICPGMIATDMTKDIAFVNPEQMIETSDICKTVDYLLSLSNNAIPLEVAIHCAPFIAQKTRIMHEACGLNE